MSEKVKEPYTFVKQKIQSLLYAPESTISRTLAHMRRGIGKHPGSTPWLWDVTLAGLPESMLSSNYYGDPTYGEWAVHTAMTLFALHQQSHDPKSAPMSKDGEEFGKAIRKLVAQEDALPRIKRRFDAMITSDNMSEVSHHLRGLIQLLKSKHIPLDYPSLAQDLYWFQVQKTRDNVRLKWGQDFYYIEKKETKENGE